MGAAVVEHGVAEDLEAGALQCRDAPPKRVLAAVRAVEVIQVPRPARYCSALGFIMMTSCNDSRRLFYLYDLMLNRVLTSETYR